MAADELVLDPGVLRNEPICEFQGTMALPQCGGVAVLPWRAEWLEAQARELRSFPSAQQLLDAQFHQCLVHLQKSRAATWQDLADAWHHLQPGGQLLFCGGNKLGITSAVKRLAGELGQRPRILANRRHARIVAFERDSKDGPVPPETNPFDVPIANHEAITLLTKPGVFSAQRLDSGTKLLLNHLQDCDPPDRILDLGCGVGPLGLSALKVWPNASALLLDGDARAIDCAQLNAEALGLQSRCEAQWWDAQEATPLSEFDLVLLNPPFHGGKEVNLDAAHAMFEAASLAVAPGGIILIVANRTLPYESALRQLGEVKTLQNSAGYKVLSLKTA